MDGAYYALKSNIFVTFAVLEIICENLAMHYARRRRLRCRSGIVFG